MRLTWSRHLITATGVYIQGRERNGLVSVGVELVRVGRNGVVLRYSGHDDVRRRPNHDLS